eukprot:781094-Pelagomonas_calceolata.AAC.1
MLAHCTCFFEEPAGWAEFATMPACTLEASGRTQHLASSSQMLQAHCTHFTTRLLLGLLAASSVWHLCTCVARLACKCNMLSQQHVH